MTLTATHRGAHLPPPPAGQLLLEACAFSPPLAPPHTVTAALQPHILQDIIGFAVCNPLDAA